MVAFASLILSLVVGPQPVELLVGEGVAAVEVRLDGESVARLTAAPWRTTCDFGEELRPHRLEAVALDGDEVEIGRAQQWINLPRPVAETSLVLKGGEGGRGVLAQLAWRNLFGAEPVKVLVSLDGRPLSFEDPRRIALPPFDPDQLHFLRVELQFADGVASVAEMSFGGSFGEQVSTRLTSVPVVLARRKPPSEAVLRSWLRKGDAPLEVLAVDKGPAEIVIVTAESARPAIDQLAASILDRAQQRPSNPAAAGMVASTVRRLRQAAMLRSDQRVRFVDTRPRRLQETGYALQIFPSSEVFDHRDGGLLWLLSQVRPLGRSAGGERVADAVAAAALAAARQNRRRVVVLLRGAASPDESQLRVEVVRRYLRHLRVPLVVWSTTGGETADPEWGEVVSVSTLNRLEAATRRLVRELERQRIVWIEGAHLPNEIRLAPEASGASLAGG